MVALAGEPFGDTVTKIHTWYLQYAVPVSIMLLVATAVSAFASEHRRWGIVMGGIALVIVFNGAGAILDAWSPVAT